MPKWANVNKELTSGTGSGSRRENVIEAISYRNAVTTKSATESAA